MKKYSVYHAKNGFNTFCEPKMFEYEFITTVEALDLQKIFRVTQNDWSAQYAALGVRSTSVGDIIYDMDTHTAYVITGTGFKPIDFDEFVSVKTKIEPDITFQSEMKRLLPFINALLPIYGDSFPILKGLSVLVQNMSVDDNKVEDYIKVVEEIREYGDESPFVPYICNEILLLHYGFEMLD